MKRRSFFALVLGGLAGLFGLSRKPEVTFVPTERLLKIDAWPHKSGPVYMNGEWIDDYDGPYETQEELETALRNGEIVHGRAFKLKHNFTLNAPEFWGRCDHCLIVASKT